MFLLSMVNQHSDIKQGAAGDFVAEELEETG